MAKKLQLHGSFPSKAGDPGKSAYEVAVDQGFKGSEAAWLASLKGDTGATGPQGPQGEKGDTGEQGLKGDTGPQGERGLQGEIGPQGPAGKDGTSVTHSWNGTTLTVTSASGTTSADLKGDKGDTGEQGPAGADGPQGEKGETGATGPQGPQGPQGDPGFVSVKDYGAIGDGETDDTDAIQAALDVGGIVYFPAGLYKVTRQLTTNAPCTIWMERIYPGSYNEDATELSGYDHAKADYPTSAANMGFGARIESYATDGVGLLVTDGSSVDGLAIRAMTGFSGVLLKYDGSKGCRSYPSTSRLRHIKVDCDISTIKPESLFDFYPYGNYGTIVEDVVVGSNHTRQFAKYGFRSSLSFWANSIRIRDIVVDVVAEYPFYINANGKQAKNWTISNVAIQAFPCQSSWLVPSHTNIAYLNGLSALYISGCKLWDVNTDEGADSPTTVSGDVIYNGVISAAAFGNDSWFDSLDTVLTAQLAKANELNLAKLTVGVKTDEATGNHTVSMSDGTVVKTFVIPATALSDEQIANGVTQWMVENADPKPVVGKNKLNPEECYDGGLSSAGVETTSQYYWTTGFIPCSIGDVIRFMHTNGTYATYSYIYMFDENKNMLTRTESPAKDYEVATEGTAYVRLLINKSTGNYYITYDNRANTMVTINDSTAGYEPYTVTMEGGIAQYIDLDAVAEKIDLTEYLKKTEADTKYALKTEIPDVPSYTTEEWTFELEDGSTVTRTVVLA